MLIVLDDNHAVSLEVVTEIRKGNGEYWWVDCGRTHYTVLAPYCHTVNQFLEKVKIK